MNLSSVIPIYNEKGNVFLFRPAAFLAVLIFFSAGFFNLNRYGTVADEPALMLRADNAWQLVSALASGDFQKAKIVASGTDSWCYLPSLYPLLNYRVVGSVLVRFGMNRVSATHVLNLLSAALALIVFFKLAAEIRTEEEAFYATLFFMLFPRFIAYAQYNPKEIPALAASLLSILYSWKFLKTRRLKSAKMAGIWMGIAAAIHLESLVLLPIFPLVVIINSKRGERLTPVSLFLGITCLTLHCLWPTLWVKPLFLTTSLLHYMTPFSEKTLLYFGNIYPRAQVPWTYYPFYLFAATPLLTWVFIAMGVVTLMKRKKQEEDGMGKLLILLWTFLPIAVRLNSSVLKYDGIRHIFFSIPPLMILAGIGLKRGLSMLQAEIRGRVGFGVKGIFWVGLAVYFAGQIAPVHPYEGEYFNEAVRLLYPHSLERWFEFPVWTRCYPEVADWLNRNALPNASVRFSLTNNVFKYYPKRSDLIVKEDGPATYTVVSGQYYPLDQPYADQTPLFEIRRYDSRLLAIYNTAW